MPGWGNPHSGVVALYVGKSQRGNSGTSLALGWLHLLPPLPRSNLGPSWAGSQGCGFVWRGLSNELSCEAGNFSCLLNPHSFFQSEVLRLYFPELEPWVAWSVSLPGYYPLFICLLCQLPLCRKSSPSWLPVSTSPTSLNECFFNSLVVRLPHSLIFWQF